MEPVTILLSGGRPSNNQSCPTDLAFMSLTMSVRFFDDVLCKVIPKTNSARIS